MSKIQMDGAMNEAGWAFVEGARKRDIEIGGKLWNNCKPILAEVIGVWLDSRTESSVAPSVVKTGAPTAPAILEAAAGHMKDRAATYDKPAGERSMGATVKAFEAVTGVAITEEQGWLFMQLLKAVRSQQGAYRADSYEDGAAYVALAGEAAARDRS